MASKSVLIVASHPDDEILGVGGTAASHAMRGERVDVLILAEGATSRDQKRDAVSRKSDIASLQSVAAAAAQKLGTNIPLFGGFPDNRMDQCDLLDIVKVVESAISEFDPDIIYTHHGSDLNIDHYITHRSVLTACRPLPDTKRRAIYTFETVSSTEWGSDDIGPAFRPQRFVDISATLEIKLSALELYESEMRAFPHARSLRAVEALARLRGSQVGCEAAEAFGVVREIVRS